MQATFGHVVLRSPRVSVRVHASTAPTHRRARRAVVQCVHSSVPRLHGRVRRAATPRQRRSTTSSPRDHIEGDETMSDTTAPTRPLPPGVTEAELDSALAAFAEAIGADKVATDAEVAAGLPGPVPGARRRPRTCRRPSSARRASRTCRRSSASPTSTASRSWPISRGKNNGYGGAAPQVRGSVMLSFRNMNKVLEINEELGYAIVEPGVSWFDLHDAIEAGGHDLVASIVDIGWGGVVSNTLEHGLTYMPYSHRPGLALRLRGRAARRRPDAHRLRRHGQQPDLAAVQARSRPDVHRAVHAVQLRHRHEDGLLADAEARGLHAALAAAVGRRADARRRRRAARAHARRHDRHAPAAVEHALHGLDAHRPRGLVRRRRARCPTRSSTRSRRNSGSAAG